MFTLDVAMLLPRETGGLIAKGLCHSTVAAIGLVGNFPSLLIAMRRQTMISPSAPLKQLCSFFLLATHFERQQS